MFFLRFLLLVFCPLLVADESVLFTIKGSNTVGAKLVPVCAKDFLMAEGFEEVEIKPLAIENEYLVEGKLSEGDLKASTAIRIEAHGSSTGFKGLMDGSAHVAMSSRPIKGSEAASLSHAGDMRSSQSEHTIAIDGLAIIVHPDNPVNTLTVEQVAGLFSGEIENWQAVGGLNRPVDIYARDDKSGTWDTFKKLVLNKVKPLSKLAERFESNDRLSDAVAININAIGFVGLASVRASKLLAVSESETQAMKPSAFSVATEDYPLSRRLYLYQPTTGMNEHARRFIEHCQSARGQALVDDIGFVSQNIRTFSLTPDKHMPEHYRQLVKEAKRLSLNFRFASGSPKLDTKASRDIVRLSDYLKNIDADSYIYLVGFSDAGDRFSEDMVLSRFRALAVRSALLKRGVRVTDSYGLGSFLPVADNSTGNKAKNGRVEVWVSSKPLSL